MGKHSMLNSILGKDVGMGIYEGEGTTQLDGMIPIDGVHSQCNLIFAQTMRRICGDYMENKCEIIPVGLDSDINELTENVLANDTLMNTLNKVIAMEYAKMYGEDYEEPQVESPIQNQTNTKEEKENQNEHEVVEMDYFGN